MTTKKTHETHELSEKIVEGGHDHHGHPAEGEGFRKGVSVFIGFLALLLTINGVAGSAAMKETINANIKASDNYAFYQAKYLRQTAFVLAAKQLELMQSSLTGVPEKTAQDIAATIAQYRETADRYESDTKSGEGKKELLARAKGLDEQRDEAQKRDVNFEFGEGLLQIAIVLASTSLVGMSRRLLYGSCAFAVIGALLALNGFTGLIDLRAYL
ncbi:MAG TPA: DUF4337 domain-containing protein [Aliidongia sp.]|nr:DUF4337 domain-containing protein [Aliidongia sp.]